MNRGGLLMVVVGLLLLWLGITGRLDCFAGTMKCLAGDTAGPDSAGAATTPTGAGETTALERVTRKYGGAYRFPGFEQMMGGRTPPFAG